MRGPRFLLGLILAAAALGLLATTHFQARLTGLFPQDLPSVRALVRAEAEQGDQQEVVLVFRDPPADSAKPEALAQALAALPGVAEAKADAALPGMWAKGIALGITQLPSASFARVVETVRTNEARARLARAREDLAGVPDDETVARVLVDPLGLLPLVSGGEVELEGRVQRRTVRVKASGPLETFSQCAEFTRRIREEAARILGPGQVLATGRPAFVADISSEMRSDMLKMTGFTVAGVVLLFCLVYRSVKPLGALLLLQAGALLLALLAARLFFRELNVICIGFASILLGLGIDYCLLAYQQTATGSLALDSWRRMRAGIWFSALTAGGVFGLLAFSSFPGLSQLGILVMAGLVAIAAFATLLLPRWATASWGRPSPAWEERFERLGEWAEKRRRLLAGLAALVLLAGVAAGWAGGRPLLETDLGNLQPRHIEAYRGQEWLMPSGREGREPMPMDPAQRNANRPAWEAGAEGRVADALHGEGFEPDPDGLTLAVLRELDAWKNDPAALEAFAAQAGAWDRLRRELMPAAVREAAWLGAAALAAVLLLAGLALRSWRRLAWLLAGLGLSAGVLLWILLVTGTRLSFLSLLALPLAFGVAVDYVYHVLLGLEAHRGSLRKTWGELGLPLTLNAATAVIGFESPFLSGQPALRDFGLVLTCGVAAAYVAGFLLFPLVYAPSRAGEKHYSQTLYRASWFNAARWLARFLPRRVLRLLGAALAVGYAGCRPGLCRTVRGNLALIAPEHAGRRDALVVYRRFGNVLGDYFALAEKPVEQAVALIRERRGFEHLKRARDAGKGGIMAAAHMGFFELGGALTIELDFPTVALTLPEPEGALTQWRRDYRRRWGVETLELSEDPFVLLEMRKILAEGKFLAALFDRPYGAETALVELPGGRAKFAGGLVMLALLTGSPILPAVITARGMGYEVHAHEPIVVEKRGSREETIRHYLQELTNVFLPYWRRDPHQWFQFIDVRG